MIVVAAALRLLTCSRNCVALGYRLNPGSRVVDVCDIAGRHSLAPLSAKATGVRVIGHFLVEAYVFGGHMDE